MLSELERNPFLLHLEVELHRYPLQSGPYLSTNPLGQDKADH